MKKNKKPMLLYYIMEFHINTNPDNVEAMLNDIESELYRPRYKKWGKFFSRQLKGKEHTLIDCAAATGLSRLTIERYSKGKSFPGKRRSKELISNYLGISTEKLKLYYR